MISLSVRGGDQGKSVKAGEQARVVLSVKDPATGFPLNGLRPALWLVPDENEQDGCENWVNRLAGQPTAPDGVVDLNGFDLLQATRDGTLALVDPKLNLATANIKAVMKTGREIVDWALSPTGEALLALDKQGQLSFFTIDPLAKSAGVDQFGQATAVAAVGKGFVAGFNDGSLKFFDVTGTLLESRQISSEPIKIAKAEQGPVAAFGLDGRGIFLDDRQNVQAFSVGQRVAEAAFSLQADSLYLLASEGTTLVRVGRDSPDKPTVTGLSSKFVRMKADAKGGKLALWAADNGSVSIYDASRNRVRWTIEAADPIVDMLFSESFLYLMHERRGGVTRVVFDPAGGEPGIAMIAAGSSGELVQQRSPLTQMVSVPGMGILVSSPRDRAAFMVAEDGAQAAMASLPLKAGETTGLLLRYRGPKPGPVKGEYLVDFVPRYGGKYIAVARIDQPALVHCARVAVSGRQDPGRTSKPANTKAVARPTLEMATSTPVLGSPFMVGLSGLAGDTNVVEALAMRSDGSWRGFAKVARVSENRFAIDVKFPSAGPYELFLEVADTQGKKHTLGAQFLVKSGQ